ncbi:MAG: response regulator [Myxococcales bacterium]|nr:response regulator [Myxococcales bacterium]
MARSHSEAGVEPPEARWLTEPLRGIFEEGAQRRVLYLISFTCALALVLEFAYLAWTGAVIGRPLQVAIALGLVAFLAVPGVVRATSSTGVGGLVVLVAMSGLVIVPAYYQGGASAIFTIWFLLVPLMAGFLLGHRFAVLLGVVGVVVMTGLFVLEADGRLPAATMSVDPFPAWLNLVMVLAFSATVGAVSSRTYLVSSKRIQEATRAEAAKARALEEAIEGIAQVDGQGRFETVNSSFAAMHASSAREMLGSAADDWVEAADRAEVEQAVESLEEKGKVELTLRGRRRDGSRFLEDLVVVGSPDGEPGEHYRFARDVTQQRELTERLNQSVKMEAIGRLAGGIAHDFNNLLMTILTAADQLDETSARSPSSERRRELLGWIATAAQRAAVLTRQLLDFSHVQEGGSRAIDVHESLERLIDVLSSTLGSSIDVVSEFASADLYSVGDVARFESGLMNLAVNARDAMPGGGTLCFRTGETRLDPSDPRFAAFQLEGDRFVCIEVSDTGTGIDPEVQEKIFDPFYTTKTVGKGTGLGLSLFYTYAREMRGALEVESEPGVGTSVRIYLPFCGAPFVNEEVARPTPTSRPEETVLLAEDEAVVAELLRSLLNESGYEVIVCADGREAVERFRASGVSVDVALLDYRMPVLDGVEAFEAIRAEEPGVPVILMSGDISAAQLGALKARGLSSVLRKPCSRDEVLREVREALDVAATGR